jgi:hypothetical protein
MSGYGAVVQRQAGTQIWLPAWDQAQPFWDMDST